MKSEPDETSAQLDAKRANMMHFVVVGGG